MFHDFNVKVGGKSYGYNPEDCPEKTTTTTEKATTTTGAPTTTTEKKVTTSTGMSSVSVTLPENTTTTTEVPTAASSTFEVAVPAEAVPVTNQELAYTGGEHTALAMAGIAIIAAGIRLRNFASQRMNG